MRNSLGHDEDEDFLEQDKAAFIELAMEVYIVLRENREKTVRPEQLMPSLLRKVFRENHHSREDLGRGMDSEYH